MDYRQAAEELIKHDNGVSSPTYKYAMQITAATIMLLVEMEHELGPEHDAVKHLFSKADELIADAHEWQALEEQWTLAA